MANLTKQEQTGRSMVEMLGVLAVIGVLSIAGVAGYTNAMNKHRANEILNGASVRAMVVSTKLQKDKDAPPTLAEFGDETVQGVTYGTPAKVGEKQFKIPLSGSGLTTDVCSQIKNITDENGIVHISDECDILTYNNDLSAGVIPEPINPKGSECDTACTVTSGTAICNNGYCECETGIWQPSGMGTGTCKTSIKTGDCQKNSDCETGYYCAITTTASVNQCETPNKGICTSVGNLSEHEYGGKIFLMSSATMTWWAARNWCLAQNKSIVSLADTDCTTKGHKNWSDLLKSTAFGSTAWWTSDSSSSCNAYYVATTAKMVSSTGRNVTTYALCK